MQDHLGSPTTEDGRLERRQWVQEAKEDGVRQAVQDLMSARDAIIAQKVDIWQDKVHVMFICESKSCSDVYSRARTVNHSRG